MFSKLGVMPSMSRIVNIYVVIRFPVGQWYYAARSGHQGQMNQVPRSRVGPVCMPKEAVIGNSADKHDLSKKKNLQHPR